jgi:hypothetical protein
LNFDIFSVADPWDNVIEVAECMNHAGLFPERKSKILIDSFPDYVIEDYDMKHIVEVLDFMTMKNAKIMICGKGCMSKF